MNNDLLTINGVPIIYKPYLSTDDKGDVKTYVRNVRPGDDPANFVFVPKRGRNEQTKSR